MSSPTPMPAPLCSLPDCSRDAVFRCLCCSAAGESVFLCASPACFDAAHPVLKSHALGPISAVPDESGHKCPLHGENLSYQCAVPECHEALMCVECKDHGAHSGHEATHVQYLQASKLAYVEVELVRLAEERAKAQRDLQHLLKYHSKDRITQQKHYTTQRLVREFEALQSYLTRKESVVAAELESVPVFARGEYRLDAMTPGTREMVDCMLQAEKLMGRVEKMCSEEGTPAALNVQTAACDTQQRIKRTFDVIHEKVVVELKQDVRSAREALRKKQSDVCNEIASLAQKKLTDSAAQTATLVQYLRTTDALVERLKATAAMSATHHARHVALSVRNYRRDVQHHARPQPDVFAGIITTDTQKTVQTLFDERYCLQRIRAQPHFVRVAHIDAVPPRVPRASSVASTSSFDDCASSLSDIDDCDMPSSHGLSNTPDAPHIDAQQAQVEVSPPAPTPQTPWRPVAEAIEVCYRLVWDTCINDSGVCEGRYVACGVKGCQDRGCAKCVERCGQCGDAAVCRSCTLECRCCNARGCRACERMCSACGSGACAACVVDCAGCAAPQCATCAVTCVECSQRGCAACFKMCAECRKPVCGTCKDRYYNWSRMSNSACYPRHSVP